MWVDRYEDFGGFGEGYGGRSAGGPMRRGWRDEPPAGRRGFSPRRRYSPPPAPMEFCIRMRGLPYHASERDIIEVSQKWFSLVMMVFVKRYLGYHL